MDTKIRAALLPEKAVTKKKPGAVRGRPKGSGEGLAITLTMRVTPDVLSVIEAEAEARAIDRSVVLREIVSRWARRKGAKR